MLKIFTTTLLLITIVTTQAQKKIYVTPAGSSNNSGINFINSTDFFSAVNTALPADTIFLQAGTYIFPYQPGNKNTIVISKSGASGKPIVIIAVNGKAIFDFSYPPTEWIQDGVGFSVTGSYLYFKGIEVTRAGYQGVYVKGSFNIFDNCAFYNNRNSGIEVNKGGSYTTLINCDAYKNYDPKKGGSMADGFAIKQTMGPGNKLVGCRAWENSDDGYDTYDSDQAVIFDNCWAFNNGYIKIDNVVYTGNKNGFKIGGLSRLQNNILYNCISFGHKARGFDENTNTGGNILYNCLAYANNVNYYFPGNLASGQSHTFKNNISLTSSSSITIKGSFTQSNNSWSSGFSVSKSDFVSLDTTKATSARMANGALPVLTLFKLKFTSKLIDKGITVNRPFVGKAPDVGSYEYGDLSAPITTVAQF